jgi:Ketosteroid isomerase-related protein
MGNSDKHRDAHEAFNRRDWDGVIRDFAADAEYIDHPRGMTTKSAQQFVDYLKGGWTSAFSDATVTNGRYIETADRSIAQFDGTGTNDGPLGPMPATGKSMNMPFCEIMTYGADGVIVRGELYYDQVSMLVQLGHMPPPEG